MSKVIYQPFYGLWGNEITEEGNIIDKEGNIMDKETAPVQYMPMCPKCKEPTYSEDNCPFCGEELEYEEDDIKI